MSAYPAPVAADPTDVGWKRFLAAIIDVGIGAVISVPLFFLLSEDTYRYDLQDGLTRTRELRGVGLFLFSLWWLAYNVGVFVLQRGFTGKTVGSMALGIVTVDERGEPIGAGRALIRSVVGIVDYIPCCLPLVGIVTILTTPGHRRVGDMAASSYVVDRQHAGQPVVVPPRAGTAPTGPTTAPTPAPGWGPSGPPPAAPPAPGAWGAPAAGTWGAATPPPTAPPVAPPAPAPGPPAAAPVPPAPAPEPEPAPAPEPEPALPSQAPTLDGEPPPVTPDSAASPAAPTPAPTRGAPTPQWDATRNAYMAWDPDRQEWLQFDQATQRWLQYDAAAGQWRPVDG